MYSREHETLLRELVYASPHDRHDSIHEMKDFGTLVNPSITMGCKVFKDLMLVNMRLDVLFKVPT